VSVEDPQRLVQVGSYRDPWEARLAWGRLQTETIPAYVIHENHIWMCWPISQALGGVKLLVPLRKRDEATAILDAMARGEYDGLLDVYEPVIDDRSCPRCQAVRRLPRFSPLEWLMLRILWLRVGIFNRARRHWLFCRDCSFISDRELSI
jgi:hypothetical protein